MKRNYNKRRTANKFKDELYWLIILYICVYVLLQSQKQIDLSESIYLLLSFFCTVSLYAGVKWVMEQRKKNGYLKSDLYKIDKMSGEQFEELIKYHFIRLGYRVELTPKSHDFGADLVLKKCGEVIVVQAKRYSSKVGIKAVQEVIGARAYYKANQGYVITNQYCTKSAKELAERSNIIIWDRNIISQKLINIKR